MAKLIYSAIASLDGYVADEEGNFDCAQKAGASITTAMPSMRIALGFHMDFHLVVSVIEIPAWIPFSSRRLRATMAVSSA